MLREMFWLEKYLESIQTKKKVIFISAEVKEEMFCGRSILGQCTFPLLATFPSTHSKKEVSQHSPSDRLLLARAVFSQGD